MLTGDPTGTECLEDVSDLVVEVPGSPSLRVVDRQGLWLRPNGFALDAGYPNPFNPATTIPFAVAEEGMVRIKVYNVLGHETATLASDVHQPGLYRLVWEARDALGRRAASGIYIVRITAPGGPLASGS